MFHDNHDHHGSPADKEEDDADADVGKDHTHPDLHGERVHEGEDAGADLSKCHPCHLKF